MVQYGTININKPQENHQEWKRFHKGNELPVTWEIRGYTHHTLEVKPEQLIFFGHKHGAAMWRW